MADLLRLARTEWVKLTKHLLSWGLLLTLLLVLGLQIRGLYTGVRDDSRGPGAVRLDPALLEGCVGEYEVAGAGIAFTVVRDGDRLLLRVRTSTEQRSMALYPVSETRFASDTGVADVEFFRDEMGRAGQLRMFDGEQTLPPATRRDAHAEADEGRIAANQLLLGLVTEPSYRDRLAATVLPGVLARVPHIYDWLIVATILLCIPFVGQEFGWGTMRAVLARGASRTRLMVAKFLALALLLACYVLVLWLASVALGLWTTRALTGSLDWGTMDGAFWVTQIGILIRTWLIAVLAGALTMGVYLWAGRSGPGFSLRFLGYFLSLIAYVFVMMMPMLVLLRPEVGPSGFGDTALARLIELLPHYNTRIVAHWGDPSNLYEMDYGVWAVAKVLNMRYDPWYAMGLLVLYGLVPFVGGLLSFRRREMRP